MYNSPIRMIDLRVRWEKHVAHMGEEHIHGVDG
jgi:hypothetical protein